MSARVGERLRDDVEVGEHGHEVRVSRPTRHDVHVEVRGDARPGDRAEVDPDVEPLGADRVPEPYGGLANQAEERVVIGVAEIFRRCDVLMRNDEEVARGDRVAVQHHERPLGRAHDATLRALFFGSAGDSAKDALAVLLGGQYVLHAPRRPERIAHWTVTLAPSK